MSKELEQRIRDLEHKLSLLEQVEKGGVKKKEYDCLSEPAEQCLVVDGFNSAIDLCNAEWAKRLKGIEKIIRHYHNCNQIGCPICSNLAQAIMTYLTKNDS